MSNTSLSSPQTVYAEGDTLGDFYILLTGRVVVSINGRAVSSLVDRSYFGELEALEHSPRVSTAVAAEPVHALRIQQRVYAELWPRVDDHRRLIRFLKVGAGGRAVVVCVCGWVGMGM
jgi:CRP-like cAMP-binding protein